MNNEELKIELGIDEWLELIKEDKNLNGAYISICQYIHLTERENQELKKQLEEYKNNYFKLSEENDKYSIKLHKYKTQQKKFIKYLEHNIKHYKEFIKSNGKDMTEQNHIRFEKRLTTFQEILQKYKEITKDDK